MSRDVSPDLVGKIRATVSDAYYDARNTGQTMEWAADNAVAALLPIIASVDDNAHQRGLASREVDEALYDKTQAFLNLAADVMRHTERDWCHDHDPANLPDHAHVWLDGHQRTTMICPPEDTTPEENP